MLKRVMGKETKWYQYSGGVTDKIHPLLIDYKDIMAQISFILLKVIFVWKITGAFITIYSIILKSIVLYTLKVKNYCVYITI